MATRVPEMTDRRPELPTAPGVEEWRAMTAEQREQFLVAVNEALSDPYELMSEGRPHKKAKSAAVDELGLYFRSVGRAVYLAEEMSVVYPGQKPLTPDILAVCDVPEPEDDERMAWVVVDEGKGLDVVIEVLHRGDRDKDLKTNVVRYAALGIPEYFVYDRAEQRIVGHRLPGPGAGRYQRVVPQSGRHHSTVLDLDLCVVEGNLRFLHGSAELFGSATLIGRLQGMVETLTTRADEILAREDEAHARAQQAIAGMQGALLALVDARGLACPDDARDRVRACADPAELQQWLVRAATARSVDEVFSPPPPAA
jgi:Uma2 family endonuclease